MLNYRLPLFVGLFVLFHSSGIVVDISLVLASFNEPSRLVFGALYEYSTI